MQQAQVYRPVLQKSTRIIVVVTAILALSACTSQDEGIPLTPAQVELQQANQRFAIEEGAVVGALGGALIGYLAGGAKGAVIGAAAGGVVGGSTGYVVVRKNLEKSHTEADLQMATREANADADADERSAIASAHIAADFGFLMADLNARYAARTISAAQFQTSVTNYRNSSAIMRKQIASMESESAGLHSDADTYGSLDLRQAATRIDAARQREAASLRILDLELSAVPAE